MKYLVLGLLLGLLMAFPPLAVPVVSGAAWLAVQPIAWAFCAGIVARPRIARHFPYRSPR